jgi:hypothetical protein
MTLKKGGLASKETRSRSLGSPGEPASPGQRESPFPLDHYLSWMSTKLLNSQAVTVLSTVKCILKLAGLKLAGVNGRLPTTSLPSPGPMRAGATRAVRRSFYV